MKKEFTVERQGRTFVLYAGLLDEAHGRGLKSIRTELLQVPMDQNGHQAVVLATVETEAGTYTGLGDAAPNNVAPPMRTCLIRMAETRAKARALRDAVNVAAVAFEELPPDDDEIEHDAPVNRPTPLRRASVNEAAATPQQVKAIYGIARYEMRLTEEETDERCRTSYGKPPVELSKRQASEVIDRIKAGSL